MVRSRTAPADVLVAEAGVLVVFARRIVCHADPGSLRARMRSVRAALKAGAGRLGRLEDAQVGGCDTSQHECSSCGMCYYNERRPSRCL